MMPRAPPLGMPVVGGAAVGARGGRGRLACAAPAGTEKHPPEAQLGGAPSAPGRCAQ